MNWIQRKIYLYNVTFGLFMLDWWERCLFSILMITRDLLFLLLPLLHSQRFCVLDFPQELFVVYCI
ncbi:unnamed protein product [Linum tenue]|uniref:Uncharacterized protein n=1 Tax=Linum tenue TaxID=586396 RepID=A0AAV0LPP9_9ROSI|nr:unnamed protein product [Linum tenue]